MLGPNEFWLCLRQLADAYKANGLNTEERMENILADFRQMPNVVRRETLNDFRELASSFPDLFALAVAADRLTEKDITSKRTKGVA